MIRILILLSFVSSNLYACAVCYGDPNSPMTHGMNMGILTLLFFIGFILTIVLFFIITLYIKSKKMESIN
ncbi:MAG: hypothetical protein CMG07_06150 [Candidatus Marinimicrobia bacterium]|nr:hypothetical protein [Candidatus Neomarinimicrobiota bacterium]